MKTGSGLMLPCEISSQRKTVDTFHNAANMNNMKKANMNNMKKANRLRAIEYLRQDIFYLFQNRMASEERYRFAIDYDEDTARSEYQAERNKIRELLNVLRALREND
jgi:hypothetical protein